MNPHHRLLLYHPDLGITTAAVCVYHNFVAIAVQELSGSGIPVAAVSTGFPAGQIPLALKLAQIQESVRAGAAEIDIVISRARVLTGDWTGLYDEVRACREACGEAHLKTISGNERARHAGQCRQGQLGMHDGRRGLHQDQHRQGVGQRDPALQPGDDPRHPGVPRADRPSRRLQAGGRHQQGQGRIELSGADEGGTGQHQKSIVPYSLFDETLLYGTAPEGKRKRKKGLLDLDPPPRFDLVIVDEAHHIRNQDTFSHKAVKFFCEHAEAVVFLTATPIQLGSNDLFVLLNTIRPDLIIDQESFSHMAEPNPFVNQAVSAMRSQAPEWQNLAMEALDQAASTPWGQAILRHNPDFGRVRSELLRGGVTHEERIKAAGHDSPPTYYGVPYDTMQHDPATATDEAHNFAPHFDRHVWVYRENPNGVFKSFNPAVSCAHHVVDTAVPAP